MIRLALMLTLFASLAVASVVHADPSPSATPETQEPEKSSVRVTEDRSRPEKRFEKPRWAPRQARRRGEYGPAVTPYPVLLAPTGIPNLHF
jgi:hypothetical protein